MNLFSTEDLDSISNIQKDKRRMMALIKLSGTEGYKELTSMLGADKIELEIKLLHADDPDDIMKIHTQWHTVCLIHSFMTNIKETTSAQYFAAYNLTPDDDIQIDQTNL